MASSRLSSPRRVLFSAIVLLLVMLAVEGAAFATTRVLVERGWIAYVPRFSNHDISRYLHLRNPTLGWGPAIGADGNVVEPQPRPDPLSTPGESPCTSTYGDSFTYGAEVEDDEAYPHFLSQITGCNVRNYGVDGYGSDQALMLFRAQLSADSAQTVILGHLSENILRNVNQYRNLLYPGSPLQFKPRFVQNGHGLRRVPIPVNGPRDFRALEQNPASVVAADALLTRPRPGFPYTITLIRWLFTDLKLRAKMEGVPVEAAFYAPTHPTGALDLTTRILSTFAREADEQGKRGIILLLPTAPTMRHAWKTGVWVDQPLADGLRGKNLSVIHAGPEVLARIRNTDPCRLFEGCKQHHFNAAGNRLVAEIVAEHMVRSRDVISHAP